MKHRLHMLLFAVMLLPSTCLLAQEYEKHFEYFPVDLRINGNVIVASGSRVDESFLEQFLALSGGEDARVLVVASKRTQLRQNGSLRAAASLDFSDIVEKATSQDNAEAYQFSEHDLDKFEKATGVIIESDESSAEMIRNLLSNQQSPLTDLIKRGGSVLLSGPAASMAGKTAFVDLDKGETKAGLGVIPDATISVGFREEQRNHLLAELARNPRSVGIGIEPGTAIVLRGRKIRVLGDGNASFYLMANEHKPLKVQHVGQAQSRRANPYKHNVDLTAWRREAIERTLEPFPSARPRKPFVENGTLIIVGGGGMPDGLMKDMVEMAGGKDAKMVYVPCTERDAVPDNNRMVEYWKSLGVKSATVFHTKDRNKANSDEKFLKPLKEATGIWFGGGRQWNFADSYYGTKAHQLMLDVLDRGGVIGGSSAGASVQGDYLARANPVANFDIMADGYERGLGFLGGVAIDQHFTQRRRQKDLSSLVERYPQLLGIGIDEATALIVRKSIGEVRGRGDVYFYDSNLPPIPWEPDYIKLGDGAQFDLEKREVVGNESNSKKD